MYSTCLFCHEALGRNELIEHFPIGRRLAFDAEKGRLWVVCTRCFRWNLTPLEERWEAIEECERLFRAQKLRTQSEHIGLTKTSEGLSLIRIGRPQRPEFAAWRYGDVFNRRLRNRLLLVGAGAVTASAGVSVAIATGVLQATLVAFPPVLLWGSAMVVNVIRASRRHLRAAYVPRRDHRPFVVHGSDMHETELVPEEGTEGWQLRFRHSFGTEMMSGDAARRTIGILMTRVNASGADDDDTREAAEQIAVAGGPEAFISSLAKTSQARTRDYWRERAAFRRGGIFSGRFGGPPEDQGALPNLRLVDRLALEMAVHEEEERRFLEEEIGPLEEAWREAEEIAKIADDLLTPSSAKEFITRHRPG